MALCGSGASARRPNDEREKARQVRFLQGRGFSLSAIVKLLRDPPGEDPRTQA